MEIGRFFGRRATLKVERFLWSFSVEDLGWKQKDFLEFSVEERGFSPASKHSDSRAFRPGLFKSKVKELRCEFLTHPMNPTGCPRSRLWDLGKLKPHKRYPQQHKCYQPRPASQKEESSLRPHKRSPQQHKCYQLPPEKRITAHPKYAHEP
jgi:hypothetical protein